MISVSTICRETFTMAVPEDKVDDLEDGEIESDEEAAEAKPEEQLKEPTPEPEVEAPQFEDNFDEEEKPRFKESKKKKKNHKKSGKDKEKFQDKNKKPRKFPGPVEDDFAGSIEKAIRKELKKIDQEEDEAMVQPMNQEVIDEREDRRKYKKRKKNDSNESTKKKRRKKDNPEEVDESEMMCVRGASPVNRPPSPIDDYPSDGRDSYASDSSHEHENRSQKQRQQRRRPHRDFRDRNKNDRDRRKGAHPMQDPDGVCLYFMQGKCHKGDDCAFSHDAEPPRKMELCKFYLMDCCAKRDKCLYMHSDFPCKYYHTGLPCIYKDDCKFSHGKPLTDNLKMILLKHIESAPKEILGDFPRLSREGASMMVANTQMKLIQQYGPVENSDKNMGSNSNQQRYQGDDHNTNSPNSFSNDRTPNKISPKVRQSRWQNESMNLQTNLSGADVLSIKNLTGVLTPKQISDLTKLGIENLNQLSQLTVMQLNNLGVTLNQVHEIQLNTMSIQKLGLINSNSESSSVLSNLQPAISASKDLDLRVPPYQPASQQGPVAITTEMLGKDVDMRCQPTNISTAPVAPKSKASNGITGENNKVTTAKANKDELDIDQYTKDALKFAAKENDNIDIANDYSVTLVKPQPELNHSKDVDHRVLAFADPTPPVIKLDPRMRPEADTDIRFLQPENYHKKPEKRHRRSTTDDDEDNQLLIDEKWYSSDEEKSSKRKTPEQSPRSNTPPALLSVIEPASSVLNRLGDLSKIDISDEVTKLLTTMKNNLQQETKTAVSPSQNEEVRRRDPRSLPKRSPDHKPQSDFTKLKSPPPVQRRPKISIYDCIEGEPTDGRRRTDVDLRKNAEFMLPPALSDTDLRQNAGGGDIDLRLGLPFKAIPNYTPASEINGSINNHPPIPFKLKTIDIPRPDYTDIRNSTAKSQALVDPRLRKVFRLSTEEVTSDSEKSSAVKQATSSRSDPRADPRADPRRKPKEPEVEQKPKTLDLQVVIQNSTWYKELSSTQKMLVNQQLATVNSLVKTYHQEKSNKPFDLSPIQGNPILCTIFTNLGITIDEKGDISYTTQQQQPPMNFNQNPKMYGMNPNMQNMDNQMGMMNPMGGMGNMNNMNMGPMGGYNNPFPDVRPGLLGIAPNIPHNFDNYGGPPNFGQDFPGNMPFNGPGNDFGGMDGDNYNRNQGRGGFRGRGNDRWNRGGNNRGQQRDRRNYNDRGGGWKNDRR